MALAPIENIGASSRIKRENSNVKYQRQHGGDAMAKSLSIDNRAAWRNNALPKKPLNNNCICQHRCSMRRASSKHARVLAASRKRQRG